MEAQDDNNKILIGRLFVEIESGEHHFGDRLTPAVYERIRRLSHRKMQRERSAHTMRPTAVMNEALVRLRRHSDGYVDTNQFYYTVAHQMRVVLVEYAIKRGRTLSITSNISAEGKGQAEDDRLFLQLHKALGALSESDATLALTCELHYFGGHTAVETAVLMGVSEPTIQRRLRLARAWLRVKIEQMM